MDASFQPQEKAPFPYGVFSNTLTASLRGRTPTCSGQVKVEPPDLGIFAFSVPEGVLAAKQGPVLCSSTFQQGYSC